MRVCRASSSALAAFAALTAALQGACTTPAGARSGSTPPPATSSDAGDSGARTPDDARIAPDVEPESGSADARGDQPELTDAASAPDVPTYVPPPPAPQYPVNRAPLQPTPFLALPIGAVRASGWLLHQLRAQAAGLSGHAEHIYAENGPTNQWLGGKADNWERGPYYVRAVTALAYVLDDAGLKANVRKWIDWAVSSQTPDGNFGPSSLDADDWWPRMLMLEAIEDAYDATGDAKLLDFTRKYFLYQAAHPTRGSDTWARARMQEDAMAIIHMYDRSPDFGADQLTKLLGAVRTATTDWIGDFNAKSLVDTPSDYVTHNVNLAMAWKAPAVYWQLSGRDADRGAYEAGLSYVMAQHGQPVGLPSGDEVLHGPGSTEGFETCGVVDSIDSHAYALHVLGDAKTGDLVETIAFNALAAATNRTMTGIDYYSLPNEPAAIHGTTKYPEDYSNGMTMSWQSGFPCCRFNWHLGWPRLTQATWAATPEGGLATLVYAPTVVTAKVAGGQTVSFDETTDYPFSERITLTFHGATAGFPLTMRIPAWAKSGSITVNGQPDTGPALAPASFHTLAHRVWNEGDTVVVQLPMPITTSAQINGSVSVQRGPLVYALQVGESWKKTTANTVDGVDFGEYEVTPTTPWNYALRVDPVNPATSFKVVTRPMPADPFVQATTPVTLQASGRLVPGWGMRTDVVLAQEVPPSPVQAPGPDVPLTLVPFGAETLRISEIPVLASAQTMAAKASRPGRATSRRTAPAKTTLVELYAPWCAACARERRHVEAAIQRLGRAVDVVRVDVDEAPALALRWRVDALPTFLVMKDDDLVARRIGSATADDLVALVQHARPRSTLAQDRSHARVTP
jgi:thiol-disulfide isomerase/thioredoxin